MAYGETAGARTGAAPTATTLPEETALALPDKVRADPGEERHHHEDRGPRTTSPRATLGKWRSARWRREAVSSTRRARSSPPTTRTGSAAAFSTGTDECNCHERVGALAGCQARRIR